jgi:hypothetical protein
MALIDKASLLMVPSTYEAGKLYNVLPSGNRAPDSTDQNSGYDQTRADFDFDRGSNAAATRVNADGLIEKYRENLLVHSNSFDVSANWGLQDATLTNGQSGYDGSLNAWLFSHSSSTAYLYQQKTLSVSVNTASIYVKKGTSSTIRLEFVTASFGKGAACSFDLENGTAGSITHYGTSSGFIANIDDVSNGWFRISLTGVTTAETWYHELALTSGNIFIQSAQLESGLVATEYLNSTSVTGKAGVLVDLPRINYDANGENGALLLEPQRTNVVTNSEYVSSNDYVVGNWTGTITTNTTETLSPEGVYNATKFVKAGASDRVYFHNSQPDGAYTGSIWLKAAPGSENTTIEISVRRFGGGGGSRTKLVTITSEWQRFDVTATNLTGGTTTAMYITDFSSQGTATEFYSYGMQIEAGNYVSSYIPCMGTSETRAADSCSVTGVSDVIGQTEGTIYAEIDFKAIGEESRFVQISDGTNNNRMYIGVSSTNTIDLYLFSGGAGVVSIFSSAYTSQVIKVAAAYADNDFVLYVNGSQIGTDTTGSVPAMSQISVGYNNIANNRHTAYGTKQATLFNERLSNAELATLTTL